MELSDLHYDNFWRILGGFVASGIETGVAIFMLKSWCKTSAYEMWLTEVYLILESTDNVKL